MPWKNTGTGKFERTQPASGSSDYVASPGVVELLRTWYADGGYYYARMERAYGKAPDNWDVLEESETAGRTTLLLRNNVTDACVRVSFHDEDGAPQDVQLSPLTPDEAYQRLLQEDAKTAKP